MNKFFAISSGAGYGLYLFLIGQASKAGMPSSVGAMTLQVVAALGGIIVFSVSSNKPAIQQIPLGGLLLAVLAGMAVQLGELLSFMAYERGLSAAAGSVIIVGLQILVPAILGIVFLKESLSVQQIAAIALIVIGVGLLSVAK